MSGQQDLVAQINALPWFHQIDFGNGILSPGSIKASKIARTARAIFDRPITGKSFLDIGCWDGAYSIEAVKRGASRVLATDHFVWNGGPGDRRSFELARQHVAPSIEVKELPVEALSVESVGQFDVVLFSGVFYHLRHPFYVLEEVAKLAKEVLIVESRLIGRFTWWPYMRFFPGSELEGDPTNWWAPNRVCMEAMLRDLGFRTIKFQRTDYRWRRGMFHAER